MIKYYLIIVSAFFFLSCTESTTPNKKNDTATKLELPKTQSSATCKETCEKVDEKLCKNLFKEYTNCNNSKTSTSCSGFINAFGAALPKTVACTNTCSGPGYNSAITYRCDEIDPSHYPKITERSSHLLSALKFKQARDLFLSDNFEAILDGALAQDIRPALNKAKQEK